MTRTPSPVPAASEAGAPTTVGVEEEFLLLRRDGTVACVAPDVVRMLAGSGNVQQEFMRFQVETTTGVCTSLAELAVDLHRERRAVARAAAAHDARLVAIGTPPFDVPGLSALTDDPRYRRIAQDFPTCSGDEVACACHVHVAVPSRDVGVHVVNRLRGWLPVLLALSANSPIWRGRISGWESYRYLVQREWPSAGIPPHCRDADSWDDLVDACIRRGHALDAPGVYYFARLSPRYPTVEIRIADTCPTVDDAVLLAGLCRALVATATLDAIDDRPYVDAPCQAIEASALAAARRGLDAQLVSPRTGQLTPALDVLHDLVAHVTPVLERTGDRHVVTDLMRRRLRRGSGAAGQRALLGQVTRERFIQRLAQLTLADGWPPGEERGSWGACVDAGAGPAEHQPAR